MMMIYSQLHATYLLHNTYTPSYHPSFSSTSKSYLAWKVDQDVDIHGGSKAGETKDRKSQLHQSPSRRVDFPELELMRNSDLPER